MKRVISKGNDEVTFPRASQNEGNADGRIGIKTERHGDAGYSLAISGGTSPNVLMQIVQSTKVIGVRAKKRVREDHWGVELSEEEENAQ